MNSLECSGQGPGFLGKVLDSESSRATWRATCSFGKETLSLCEPGEGEVGLAGGSQVSQGPANRLCQGHCAPGRAAPRPAPTRLPLTLPHPTIEHPL